ncbi:Homeobox-leucine zipper family protein / lipid-binding START domain-containing protein [Trifolium repens]|nr:Homeobox-leucine zipper family protein / lipid-binding START domain-containing protein [Trifolium repens]
MHFPQKMLRWHVICIFCISAVELMKVQLEHVLNLCLHLFDESFADDALLVPSGFRVIPLDPKSDGPTSRTLDLTSTLGKKSGTQLGKKSHPSSPEAHALARWISRSYIVESAASDAILKQLWQNSDAIMCCSVKTNAYPIFTFANQVGLDMLETILVALQDIMLDKVLDEVGRKRRKILCSEFSKIMQQVT